jgi:hypothetical protein
MNKPRPAALSRQEWLDEVTSAIASARLDWRVFAGSVEGNSPMCYAELSTHSGHQHTRHISLARDRFPTPEQRRQEIIRQLAAAGPERHRW